MKHPASIQPLPLDTADAARSIFNIENVYLSIGDQIDQLFSDLNLAGLDSAGARQANALCILAMVTIFQFAENLPDRLAVESLRTRTDWKYALHLSLVSPGLKPAALCEFRQQLLSNSSGQPVFHEMLDRLARLGLLSPRTKNWSDAKSVLLDVCAISRVDLLAQAFHLTLEALAAYQIEYLREVTLPHWYERYHRMPAMLPRCASRQDLESQAGVIGKDTRHLLNAINNSDGMALSHIPEIQDLKRIYQQQFDQSGDQISWLVVCSYCSAMKLSSLHQKPD
ncbi:MAG: transposase [Anaerolineales bacterium]